MVDPPKPEKDIRIDSGHEMQDGTLFDDVVAAVLGTALAVLLF